MQKLHFSTIINAPQEKVWKTMLEDKTYREWTSAFMPGSHFVGEWTTGSKIQFLSADEQGKMGGMSSEIVEARPYEFVSIHHKGIVSAGVEDTTSEEAKKWVGFENYTFKEQDGKTELVVEVDVPADFKDEFTQGWEKALANLKQLAEK